mmetsp:Transcript_8203/g.16559  ORF Transcript_8203/g.16559 Transcript_8203/m.16559 type:complete len:489 (+) Transcript_8203:26-1492(+)
MPFTFEDAVKEASNIPRSTPNATKAKIYGLYKCSTVGPNPPGNRPGPFNFEGRMKWDAWKAAGEKGAGKEKSTAREAYAKLIASMVATGSDRAATVESVEGIVGSGVKSAFVPVKRAGVAVPPVKPPLHSPTHPALPFNEVRQALLKLEKMGGVKLAEVKEALEKAQEELETTTTTARARLNSNMSRIGFSYSFFSLAYLSRLFVSLLFLLTTGYLNALSSNLAGYRNPQIKIIGPSWAKGTTTLPDLGHDVIGSLTLRFLGTSYIDWFELPDIFVSVLGTLTFLLLLLHPRRLLIIRRICIVFGLLNLMRSFTVIVTSLPDASPECAKQFSSTSSSYKNQPLPEAITKSLRRAFLLIIDPSSHITCGDMVFSGHTTFLTLTMMAFVEYCRPLTGERSGGGILTFIRHLVRLAWAAGLISIVGTKLHYTLDVCLAVLITVTTWRVYHHTVRVEKLREHYGWMKWMENESIIQVDEDAFQEYVRKNKLE